MVSIRGISGRLGQIHRRVNISWRCPAALNTRHLRESPSTERESHSTSLVELSYFDFETLLFLPADLVLARFDAGRVLTPNERMTMQNFFASAALI